MRAMKLLRTWITIALMLLFITLGSVFFAVAIGLSYLDKQEGAWRITSKWF